MKSYPKLSHPAVYRVCVVGRTGDNWSDFMTGYQADVLQDAGASLTVLTGTVADQPALFGLLWQIRDLGLPLVSVEYLEPVLQTNPPAGH